ncbi:MAG: T9SS type A sorting domain-containing protein, partial [Bacteroidetes bacterium]|nr:T9SS type A sorting domain-containing protein [Bacteroidota bacterium]
VDVVFLYKMVDNNYQLIAQLNKADSFFVDSFPIDGDNIYALQLGDVTTTGAYPKVSQLTTDTFFNFKRKTISIKAKTTKPNLRLFPNPANNFIVIKSEIPLEISTFEIVNAQGIICLKGITNHKTQRVGINIDNLPSGSYVIRFSNKTQNPQMVRFLKE